MNIIISKKSALIGFALFFAVIGAIASAIGGISYYFNLEEYFLGVVSILTIPAVLTLGYIVFENWDKIK